MSGRSDTVGLVGSCDRRGLDLVAVGQGWAPPPFSARMFPSDPTQKLEIFWSCDLGSQVGAKNRGFFGSDPEVVVKITISP